MPTRFIRMLTYFSIGFCLLGLVQASEADTMKKLILTGSSTVAPLVSEIAKRYESQHPGVRIDVQTGGSSRGIADTRRGLADIGMVSRSLKPAEEDLKAFPIAKDGICLIAHSSNRVNALTDEQVAKIYRGDIENWKEVGGKDAPITVVNKAEGRSTLELFLHYYGLRNQDIKADVIIGDNEQGVKTVAGNPNAIGYVSIGTAEFDAADGVPIKLLSAGTIAASTENIKNGTFPLSRPLNLVIKGAPQDIASDFIKFAASDSVMDIIKEQYFVPISH